MPKCIVCGEAAITATRTRGLKRPTPRCRKHTNTFVRPEEVRS